MIRGRLPAEEGELLLRALEAARETDRDGDPFDGSSQLGVSAETRGEAAEPAQTNADALVSVAEASLASPETGRSGGDRYQLVVHTDAQAARGEWRTQARSVARPSSGSPATRR